jgi:hypothetical protein
LSTRNVRITACALALMRSGYLQNSVWISPDPLAQEREILGGGKINVESLILLEARPCARSLALRMGEGGRQAG